MSQSGHSPHPVPFFLPGTDGRLLAVYYPPAGNTTARRAILHFPAFAEEMNKSRRMLALQARRLAAAGLGVLVVDLYGTGDSEGDFAEARWPSWQQDMLHASNWLTERGADTICYWGLRLGCLLALATARAARRKPEELMLWQPVARGEQAMTQFLRLRLAAEMAAEGPQRSTRELRMALARDGTLEVAGYTLAAELVEAIDGLKLAELMDANTPSVTWIEVQAAAGRPVSPATERLLAGCRERGARIRFETTVGEPFWTTPEISLAPKLLELTAGLMRPVR